MVQFSVYEGVGGDGTVVKLEVLDPLSFATTPHYHCHGLIKCHSHCIPCSWFIKTTH